MKIIKIALYAMTATTSLFAVVNSALPIESALTWYEQGEMATHNAMMKVSLIQQDIITEIPNNSRLTGTFGVQKTQLKFQMQSKVLVKNGP